MAKTIGSGAIERTMSPIDRTLHGEPGENIGADHRFGERAQCCLLGEALFVRVHALLAAFIDHTLGVAEE